MASRPFLFPSSGGKLATHHCQATTFADYTLVNDPDTQALRDAYSSQQASIAALINQAGVSQRAVMEEKWLRLGEIVELMVAEVEGFRRCQIVATQLDAQEPVDAQNPT